MTSMQPGQCGAELQRILERSAECAGRLDDLLHDEFCTLKSQDMDALSAITTSKELCVQHLSELEIERKSLCTAAGYDSGEAGMNDLLQWCDPQSVIAPVWITLLQSAKKCDAMNRTNGAIGRVRFEHVTSALAVLTGGTEEASLYSAAGQETARFAQRSLARI